VAGHWYFVVLLFRFGRTVSNQWRMGSKGRSLSRFNARGLSASQGVRGDVPSAEPLPRVMIFSRDKRFEMREGFFAENTIKSIESTQGGAFKIIETLGKRRFRLSKKRSFTLKIVNATTIEVTRKHQHAIV
jgi:hypothetical protein